METIQAFLKEYDHIPPEEKCMALLFAEERFLKIKQAVEVEQNQPGVMQELLLKLMDDLKPTTITPDLPIEEPNNSLIMGDNHLDTIPSVENLVPIPSEFEGISDDTCDVPVCEDPSSFDALNNHSEILSNSNDDDTSSDDNDFEDIEYVSLEEVNDVDQEENEFDLEDILQIRDSPSLAPISITDSNSFFEKSDTSFSFSDNSLPEFETFRDHTEETRSDTTTTHANNSLPEYDSFLFEVEPDQGGLTSVVMDEISDNSTNDPLLELSKFGSFHFGPSFPRPPPEPPDVEICLNFEPDTPVINNFDELNDEKCFYPGGGEIDFSQNVKDDDSFTFAIRNFLPYITYPVDSPLLLSTGSEDTIFDPDIST
ncbi:hypothetical protein Tco_1134186 [Tanacetum coccineum]